MNNVHQHADRSDGRTCCHKITWCDTDILTRATRDASMVAPDERPARTDAPSPRAADARDRPHPAAEVCADADEVSAESLRAKLGRHAVSFQQGVDANLTLVRVGLLVAAAGSAYAAVRLSGVFGRFNHVDEIPLHYFRQRKTLRVRMMRQSERDPNVFYVYHTPFLRRFFLQDTLPSISLASGKPQPLLAVRAFGVQVDEAAEEWIWSNVVSSHRPMTVQLLHKMNAVEGEEAIATCAMSIRKFPLRKDLAHELVAHGLAECLPETLAKYDDGSPNALHPLLRRFAQLEAAQKNAQTMQYGIWKDWQEDKLADRMVSAGKRVTSRGFQKLVGKVTGAQ